MPAITAPARVLVTGANGFIAVATCKALIDRGFTVIGAVRTSSKGVYLENVLGNMFSYVVVPDIEKPDAFDDAMKTNPDAIAHMASPISVTAPGADPQNTIGPAVTGTTSILHSALRFGPRVKRVVITSSAASVVEPKDGGPYTFTEGDWNNYSAGLVEREGAKAPQNQVYRASKVLAERAAWAFMDANKGSINFDLVTILPPLVFGPIYQETTDNISSLNATSAMLYKQMTSPPPNEDEGFSGNFVDVRDAALAHVLALEVPEAGGERFLASNGPFTFTDFRDELHASGVKGIAPGTPEGEKPAPPQLIADGSKASRILGLKYRPKRETVVDAMTTMFERFPQVDQ